MAECDCAYLFLRCTCLSRDSQLDVESLQLIYTTHKPSGSLESLNQLLFRFQRSLTTISPTEIRFEHGHSRRLLDRNNNDNGEGKPWKLLLACVETIYRSIRFIFFLSSMNASCLLGLAFPGSLGSLAGKTDGPGEPEGYTGLMHDSPQTHSEPTHKSW